MHLVFHNDTYFVFNNTYLCFKIEASSRRNLYGIKNILERENGFGLNRIACIAMVTILVYDVYE